MMMEAFYKHDGLAAGAKGLVFVGDQLLTYRRDEQAPIYPLSIDLPGGGANPGETPFDTFQREVKEEFGLKITPDDITYAKRYPSSFEEGKFTWFPVAKLPESAIAKIVFGNEGLEYVLMSLVEYLDCEDAWPISKERSANYVKSLEEKQS
jgi:8-oxo-dGTP diphosphatase